VPGMRCKPCDRNTPTWEWWPGTESNHRHADFQYDGEPDSARLSRRTERPLGAADRTAPPDRAYAEPPGGRPTEPRREGHAGQRVSQWRPSGDRTGGGIQGPGEPGKLGIWRTWERRHSDRLEPTQNGQSPLI
jgi:hypothetical protein